MQYCGHVQIPTCACGGLAVSWPTHGSGVARLSLRLALRGAASAHTVQLYASMKQVKRIPAAHARS